jgi:uncharacterized protein
MSETVKPIPTLDMIQAHRDAILAIAARYGAYDVRVFGSVARGEATPDSDVDFVVSFLPHSLLDRIAMMQDLQDLLGHEVDLVQEKSLREHVKSGALQDAVRV